MLRRHHLKVRRSCALAILSPTLCRRRALTAEPHVNSRACVTRWLVDHWGKDEKEKLIGRIQQKNLENMLHGMSVVALTKYGGLTAEEAKILVDEVKQDITDNQAHKRYYVAM